MPDLALEVAGQVFSGWTSARVTESIDALAPAFELTYADRWSQSAERVRIRPGQACRLLWREAPMLTGWIDSATATETASERALSVSGRARTGDLVDCSVELSDPWIDRTIEEIARDVVGVFGIGVRSFVLGDATAPIPFAAPELGETCAELLGRLARLRGCWLSTSSTGDLEIVQGGWRAGGDVPVLRRGRDILSATLTESHEARFNRLTVATQGGSLEIDAISGLTATARDPAVTRHRPLVVVADAACVDLDRRAQWEINARMGKGTRLSLTLPGWTSARDALWHPGQVVRVVDDWLGLDHELAIVSVQRSLDLNTGTTAQLELADPRVLLPEPIPDDAFEA